MADTALASPAGQADRAAAVPRRKEQHKYVTHEQAPNSYGRVGV